MTVYENLEMGGFTVRGQGALAGCIDEVFDFFPVLKERKKQLAGTMSGGEQQMLALEDKSRKLINNKKIKKIFLF